MRIVTKIMAAILACSMLLGNTVYALENVEPTVECAAQMNADSVQELDIADVSAASMDESAVVPSAAEPDPISTEEEKAAADEHFASTGEEIGNTPATGALAEPSEETSEETSEEASEEISEEASEVTSEENSEEASEATSEENSEEASEVTSEEASEETSEEASEVTSEENSEEVSEETSEEASEVTSEENSEEVSEETSEEASEVTSEENSEEVSEETSEEVSEVTSEEVSEVTSEENSEKASEEASEEPSEVLTEESSEESGAVIAEDGETGSGTDAVENNFSVACTAMFSALSRGEQTEQDGEEESDGTAETVLLMAAEAEEQASPSNTITVSEMLEILYDPETDPEKYETCLNLGKAFNLGADADQMKDTLQKMEDDYQSWTKNYEKYQQDPTAFEKPVTQPVQPRIEFDGTNLRLEKNITDVTLSKNEDGTYSEEISGETDETVHAAKTELVVNGDATMTLIYEGDTKITQTVRNDNPTDFIITVDCSTTMVKDGKFETMKSALRILLNDILADEKNTVSILCWSDKSSIVEINGKDCFSAADNMTVDEILEGVSGPLKNLWISKLPSSGLLQARDILEDRSSAAPDKNYGIVMITDGQGIMKHGENFTIMEEGMLIEIGNTSIVNVAIGDEEDLERSGYYLDPKDPNYMYEFLKLNGESVDSPEAEQKREYLRDHVTYYRIPKTGNQELEKTVNKIYNSAAPHVKNTVQTTVITDSVLAAMGAGLIDEIPAGFEVVTVEGNDTTYILGTDADGSTIIEFPITESETGFTYFVVPQEDGSAIGVATDFSGSEAVLAAQPLVYATAADHYIFDDTTQEPTSPSEEPASSQGGIRLPMTGIFSNNDKPLKFNKWSKENGYGDDFSALTEERLEKALKDYLSYLYQGEFTVKDRNKALEELVVTFTGDNLCYKNAEHIYNLRQEGESLFALSSTTSSLKFKSLKKIMDMAVKRTGDSVIGKIGYAPFTILRGMEIADAVYRLKDIEDEATALQSFGVLVPALLGINPITKLYAKPVSMVCKLASKLPDANRNKQCSTLTISAVFGYKNFNEVFVGGKNWMKINENSDEEGNTILHSKINPEYGPSVEEILLTLQNIENLSEDDPFWDIPGVDTFMEYTYELLYARVVYEYQESAEAMLNK